MKRKIAGCHTWKLMLTLVTLRLSLFSRKVLIYDSNAHLDLRVPAGCGSLPADNVDCCNLKAANCATFAALARLRADCASQSLSLRSLTVRSTPLSCTSIGLLRRARQGTWHQAWNSRCCKSSVARGKGYADNSYLHFQPSDAAPDDADRELQVVEGVHFEVDILESQTRAPSCS